MNREELKKEIGEFIDNSYPDPTEDVDIDDVQTTVTGFLGDLAEQEDEEEEVPEGSEK